MPSNYDALYQVLSNPLSWSGNDISDVECIQVLSTLISDLLFDPKKQQREVYCPAPKGEAQITVLSDSVNICYWNKSDKLRRISVSRNT
jgi:hypothetical protein